GDRAGDRRRGPRDPRPDPRSRAWDSDGQEGGARGGSRRAQASGNPRGRAPPSCAGGGVIGDARMMQLRHRTLLVMLVLAVVAGVALGSFAAGGAARMARPVAAPLVDAPILPLQMPPPPGSFSKVADLVVPAGININAVAKGGMTAGLTRSATFENEPV